MTTQPPPPQVEANGARMFGHCMLPDTLHRPDLGALRWFADRAAGTASGGELPNRSAVALAERASLPLADLPGGHLGFVTDPEPFAARLMEALGGRPTNPVSDPAKGEERR